VAALAEKSAANCAVSIKPRAKISDEGPPRRVARGRRRRPRRESVGAIRAFCAAKRPETVPKRRLPQNYFGLVNPLLSTALRLRLRACAARATCPRRARAFNIAQRKAAFHRHFFNACKFMRACAPRKNLSARVFAKVAPHSRCGVGARALHTKLSEVTVIFFLL
jgi:hypothetical protein